jgi:hypothetical protein
VITANQATLWHALRLARGPVHDVTATFGAGSSAPP